MHDTALTDSVREGKPVPYDPGKMLRDTAGTVNGAVEDLALGKAEWSRTWDTANSLEHLQELAAGLAGFLEQADTRVRLASGSDVAEASRLVREAAATAARLKEQIGRARSAFDGVR
ncbi:hypothetical protein GCM10010440_06250 [Kitasatospora cinereorecta]